MSLGATKGYTELRLFARTCNPFTIAAFCLAVTGLAVALSLHTLTDRGFTHPHGHACRKVNPAITGLKVLVIDSTVFDAPEDYELVYPVLDTFSFRIAERFRMHGCVSHIITPRKGTYWRNNDGLAFGIVKLARLRLFCGVGPELNTSLAKLNVGCWKGAAVDPMYCYQDIGFSGCFPVIVKSRVRNY